MDAGDSLQLEDISSRCCGAHTPTSKSSSSPPARLPTSPKHSYACYLTSTCSAWESWIGRVGFGLEVGCLWWPEQGAEPLTWHKARADCQSRGGDLPGSEFFLSTSAYGGILTERFMQQQSSNTIWVGISNRRYDFGGNEMNDIMAAPTFFDRTGLASPICAAFGTTSNHFVEYNCGANLQPLCRFTPGTNTVAAHAHTHTHTCDLTPFFTHHYSHVVSKVHLHKKLDLPNYTRHFQPYHLRVQPQLLWPLPCHRPNTISGGTH